MRNNMKKLLILLLGLVLVVGLAACDDGPEDPTCTDDQTLVDGECVDNEPEPEVDETAPVFSNVGDIAYTIGDADPDYTAGFSVTDDVDGNVKDDVVVDSSAVDLTVEGTYTVTLTVSDEAGNEATDTFYVVVTAAVNPNADLAALDIAALSIPDGVNTALPSSGKLALPGFGSNGTFFYWSTSDSYVITANGFIINPHVGSDAAVVTLSARCVNGTYSETVTFDVTVEPNPEVTVTSMELMPYDGTSDEYVTTDAAEVEVFYVDNGNVPYMDVETFIDMIDGAIESDELVYSMPEADVLRIDYEVTFLDFDEVTEITEEYWAEIDFTENTFTVNNFDFFESYIASTESDYGEGLTYVDASYVDGEEVTIPLGDYNFDLTIYNDGTKDNYLMPLHIANLLFAGGIYFDVYYNGDTLYGIDTFGISSSGEDDLVLQETVRTSSLNSENIPQDVKLATFNFMALTLNYFYGLKMDRGVEDYYEMMNLRVEYLMNATDNQFYNKMFDIAYDLDDLHTSHSFVGYYIDDPSTTMGLSLNDLGPRTVAFYEGLWAVQDLLEAKYGTSTESELPDYRLIDDGKTAVIYIYGFSIDTPDAYKALMDALPVTVENVVIDLSYNTGGNIGAVMRIFGYITEEQFMYHSQNPADGAAVTYFIESSYDAYDQYDYYFVSSSVTFSAANMMVSMAKELGYPVMGQASSGGASSIGVIIAPDGTVMMISTNNVLSTRVGNEVDGYEYLSVENGIEVDYTMGDVTSDNEIISVIEEHQASQTN